MNTARTKTGHQPADQQEPWYNHDQAYYHEQHGQDSPQDSYYGQQPFSGHDGAGSGYGSTPYPQYPPTPDVPLTVASETSLLVELTPKPSAVNATGRLTQNAFESWSKLQGTPQHSAAEQGKAQPVQQGTAQRSRSQRSAAQQGTAQCSAAQQGRAQGAAQRCASAAGRSAA